MVIFKNEILDTKVLPCSHFETKLSKRRSHRDSRNRTIKFKNAGNMVNNSIDNPISIIYVGRNFLKCSINADIYCRQICRTHIKIIRASNVRSFKWTQLLAWPICFSSSNNYVDEKWTSHNLTSSFWHPTAPSHHSDVNKTTAIRKYMDTGPVIK